MIAEVYQLNSVRIEECPDVNLIGSYDIYSEFFLGEYVLDDGHGVTKSFLEHALGFDLPPDCVLEWPGESFAMVYTSAGTLEPIYRIQMVY